MHRDTQRRLDEFRLTRASDHEIYARMANKRRYYETLGKMHLAPVDEHRVAEVSTALVVPASALGSEAFRMQALAERRAELTWRMRSAT